MQDINDRRECVSTFRSKQEITSPTSGDTAVSQLLGKLEEVRQFSVCCMNEVHNTRLVDALKFWQVGFDIDLYCIQLGWPNNCEPALHTNFQNC